MLLGLRQPEVRVQPPQEWLQAFPRAILWDLWHWGCQGSEQEQGAGMDILEEG